MSANILNLVKETVADLVNNNQSVPADKQTQTVDVASNAIANGLKQAVSGGNITDLMNLFKGGNTSSSNPVISSVITSVVNALVSKVGLSQNASGTIASSIVPAVVKMLSGKANDPNEKGIDLESLLSAFGGKNSGNGILGSIGKLFG